MKASERLDGVQRRLESGVCGIGEVRELVSCVKQLAFQTEEPDSEVESVAAYRDPFAVYLRDHVLPEQHTTEVVSLQDISDYYDFEHAAGLEHIVVDQGIRFWAYYPEQNCVIFWPVKDQIFAQFHDEVKRAVQVVTDKLTASCYLVDEEDVLIPIETSEGERNYYNLPTKADLRHI